MSPNPGLLLLLATCALASAGACGQEPTRTPAQIGGCEEDYQCVDAGVSKHCFRWSCVECRRDEDCKLPKMCGQLHTCFDPDEVQRGNPQRRGLDAGAS